MSNRIFTPSQASRLGAFVRDTKNAFLSTYSKPPDVSPTTTNASTAAATAARGEATSSSKVTEVHNSDKTN